ncbi:MAG: fibronectin type III domain-containing protein [Pedosphaera sp.]|nr:fibronectin type III domain-containing protein [Pedosphaera sp.]
MSSSQINLTWVDGSVNESGFRIERAINAGAFSQIALVGANIVAFSDTPLSPATSYTYRIRATNSGGDSPFSNTSTAVTLPLPPTAPSGISAMVISATQINVAWVDNSSNETGFQLEQAKGSGSFTLIATLGANTTGYSDLTVLQTTQYTYRVRAYNSGGNSAYSASVTVTTPEILPLAPSNLKLTSLNSSQIRLNWSDNSAVESGVKIERSLNNSTWGQVATVGANGVTYTDIRLNRNTLYYYRVRAYNASGNSAYSGTASVKTKP